MTELRALRQSKGLTLRDVEGITGIAFSRVHRHEKRQEILYPRDVARYAAVFDVAPELLRDSEGFAAVVSEVVEFIDGCNGDQKAKV